MVVGCRLLIPVLNRRAGQRESRSRWRTFPSADTVILVVAVVVVGSVLCATLLVSSGLCLVGRGRGRERTSNMGG